MGLFSNIFGGKPKGSLTPDDGTDGVQAKPGGISGFLQSLQPAGLDGATLGDRLQVLAGSLRDAGGADGGGAGGYQAAAMKAIQDRATEAQAAEQRKQLMGLADSLNLTPREKLTFLINPTDWASKNADRFGFHDIAQGHHAQYGQPGAADSTSIDTPTYGQEGGEGYSIGPGGMQDMGGLKLSPAQQEAAAQRKQQEQEMADYRRGMLGVAQGQLGIASQREGRMGAKGSGNNGLPPNLERIR